MSDSNTKGFAPRLIHTPGYNIHPQYDLRHLRHLLNERKRKRNGFHLNLAPMVDMFSVLVIYLIMNFSSSGEVFFVSKSVTIPKASKGVPMQSYPLISVLGNKVAFDAEKIEGEQSVFTEEVNDMQVPKLREMLRRLKRVEMQINGANGFKGQVNLQADENTPAEDVKKVMRVLIEEGWNGINFIVDPESAEK